MKVRDEYGEMKVWIVVALAHVALILFLGGIVVAVNAGEDASCSAVGRQTGRQTYYSFNTGCLIKVDGQWVPEDNWVHNDGN